MNVHDKAPDFELYDSDGNIISLKNYKGKFVVLYFYPKDMTSGCTKEACNLRDNYEILHRNNIVVLGVSTDDEESHKKFRDMHSLPFPLLCDTDGKISEKYGVYKKKSFLGKSSFGIERTTFIIDLKGMIHSVITKVDVENHNEQILKSILSAS